MTNKEGHYKLWNELARTGGGSKIVAFHRVFGVDEPAPSEYCFACQECNERGDKKRCSECPLTPNLDTSCLDGLFNAWCDAYDPDERKRLAALIRDLPWKEKENA